MKKKIIVALMAMTIAFSAVACTSANTADATTSFIDDQTDAMFSMLTPIQ